MRRIVTTMAKLPGGAFTALVPVSPVLNPLFWFASSEELTRPGPHGKKTLPRYLVKPHVIFTNIWWKSCVDDKPLNLSA